MKKLLLALIPILFASCATIQHGPTQEVGFHSMPLGATVKLNGREVGETPMARELERERSYIVSYQLEGYQPFQMALTRSTSGWVWGNIFLGGLIGLAVDASNGSMYKLNPESVSVDLIPVDSTQYRKVSQ